MVIRVFNVYDKMSNMKTHYFLWAALSIIMSLGCSGSKKTQVSKDGVLVEFHKGKTLNWVLQKAKEEDRVIFVDIYTDWCLPCKMMDQDVFSHQGTADYLNDNFLNIKVNAEIGVGLNWTFEYPIQGYPTLLFLDKDGNILTSKLGSAYHTQLRALGDEALEKAHAL